MAKVDGQEIKFKDVPASELIGFHADLAKQTKDLKDEETFEIKIEK